MSSNEIIQLNGSAGGGQILRSALSLSMVTGTPFRMINIRGKRAKPGLMRQHLTCVQAAAAVCEGSVDGAELKSREIVFRPGEISDERSYKFEIGTAGSTTLLAQTLLPALWAGGKSASLQLTGGTHNPMAPPADFLKRVFLPVLERMGARAELHVERAGFAPAGGGSLRLEIHECSKLKAIDLMERGAEKGRLVESVLAHVREDVAEKEIRSALQVLDWDEEVSRVVQIPESSGPGNLLAVEMEFDQIRERTTAFGAYGKSSKVVGREAAKAMMDYLGTGAVVGRRLADQLVLPFALAGGGRFLTMAASNHLKTNIDLIRRFLPVRIDCQTLTDGQVEVSVSQD